MAALVILAGFALIAVLAWPPQSAGAQATLYYVGPLFAMIGIGAVLPQLIGGLGLLAGQAWARWLLLAVSVPWLFAFPLGTVLGGYTIWALFGPEAVPPARTGLLLKRDQVNLLRVVAATGAVMALALFIGFSIDRRVPQPSAGPVYGPDGYPVLIATARAASEASPSFTHGMMATPLPLIGVVVVLAGTAVVPRVWRRRRDRIASRRGVAERAAQKAARLAALAADPARSPYTEKIAAGEFWSDEQIAYDLDPGATGTCAHLAPIERAMRRAGVPVRLAHAQSVAAPCRVDAAALARIGLLAPPADYREYIYTERFGDHYPLAAISCLEHGASVIKVLHPDEAKPDTPLFDGVAAVPVR